MESAQVARPRPRDHAHETTPTRPRPRGPRAQPAAHRTQVLRTAQHFLSGSTTRQLWHRSRRRTVVVSVTSWALSHLREKPAQCRAPSTASSTESAGTEAVAQRTLPLPVSLADLSTTTLWSLTSLGWLPLEAVTTHRHDLGQKGAAAAPQMSALP